MALDAIDKVIVLGGTLTAIIAFKLYTLYRNKFSIAFNIQTAESLKPGEELLRKLVSSSNQCIDYAIVEGVVKECGRSLCTENSPEHGVVLHRTLVEHISRRYNNAWYSDTKTLRDTVDIVPFALQNKDSPSDVVVVDDVLEAKAIYDELDLTHSEFTPNKSTFVQHGINRLFGEMSWGVHSKEELLKVGSKFIGIGKLILEDDGVKLIPPDTSDSKVYFFTKMTKKQLIKAVNYQGRLFFIASVSLGIITFALFTYIIWKITRKALCQRKRKQDFDAIRQVDVQRRAQDRTGNDIVGRAEEVCVVCLSNFREVITLDCGHIAMCSDCAQKIPSPYKCPVCRENIIRFLPVYRP